MVAMTGYIKENNPSEARLKRAKEGDIWRFEMILFNIINLP